MTSSPLSRLSIKGNNLAEQAHGFEACVSIIESLRINSSLTHLDLTANCIDDTLALVIANVLAENKTLRQLRLGHNKIRIKGTYAIAGSLKNEKISKSQSLEHIDFQGNDIGER